jgi:hypothetical protein
MGSTYPGDIILKIRNTKNNIGVRIMPNNNKFYYWGIRNSVDNCSVSNKDENGTYNITETA